MPHLAGRGPSAGEENVVLVVNDDVGLGEGSRASSVTQLSDGDKGTGMQVGEDVGEFGFCGEGGYMKLRRVGGVDDGAIWERDWKRGDGGLLVCDGCGCGDEVSGAARVSDDERR